jgi:protein ImuB
MLPEPTLLDGDGAYPLYGGCRLQLIDGPERLETGWWDEDGIARDYYTAVNTRGARLWIFRNRRHGASPWYLQGYFG